MLARGFDGDFHRHPLRFGGLELSFSVGWSRSSSSLRIGTAPSFSVALATELFR